jgi:hypothetical protein
MWPDGGHGAASAVTGTPLQSGGDPVAVRAVGVESQPRGSSAAIASAADALGADVYPAQSRHRRKQGVGKALHRPWRTGDADLVRKGAADDREMQQRRHPTGAELPARR